MQSQRRTISSDNAAKSIHGPVLQIKPIFTKEQKPLSLTRARLDVSFAVLTKTGRTKIHIFRNS
jgi:hypothetical protein